MQVAQLFKVGRDQAVRLPEAYRFEGDAVAIRRDPISGDVILSAISADWVSFFRLRDSLIQAAGSELAGFMDDRDQGGLGE